MKKFLSGIVAVSTILALAFTSCKSGDDDDFESLSPEDKALISSVVPSQGWSGNTENGILKYAPYEYDDDEISTYFAFNMKNGVCDNAVINIVTYSSTQAKQLAQMLNNGFWVDGDNGIDDYANNNANYKSRSFDVANSLLRHAARGKGSRAGFTLQIPVQQEGKVIYVVLTNVKGLSANEIKKVVNYWSGESMAIPDHVIFGKYANGIYTCENMHGMNIDYVIETKFNTTGFCTQFKTSITLPNENWAQFYYESYEDQMDDFEQQFGQRPELKIDGNSVILNAVIIGDLTQEDINTMVYAIDWLNNCPFVYNFFK